MAYRLPHTLRRHQHLFDPADDRCLRCGVELKESDDEVGCQAPGVTAHWTYSFALTVAEQALAKADGLDRDEALSRKTVAIFAHEAGYGRMRETLSGDTFLRRREQVELAALAAFESPKTP
jgi:hypothetical protein